VLENRNVDTLLEHHTGLCLPTSFIYQHVPRGNSYF